MEALCATITAGSKDSLDGQLLLPVPMFAGQNWVHSISPLMLYIFKKGVINLCRSVQISRNICKTYFVRILGERRLLQTGDCRLFICTIQDLDTLGADLFWV